MGIMGTNELNAPINWESSYFSLRFGPPTGRNFITEAISQFGSHSVVGVRMMDHRSQETHYQSGVIRSAAAH